MNAIRRLWHATDGHVSAISLLLLTTIVVFGAVVGLATLREHVVQELGDAAMAIENLNQSYTTSTSTNTDNGPFADDTPGNEPACLDVTVAASSES